MPDSDPASRGRKEEAKILDPRLKMSGMTMGVFAGMTERGVDVSCLKEDMRRIAIRLRIRVRQKPFFC